MRKEKYVGTTNEEWSEFYEGHATAEYGDPMKTLESLDRCMQNQGKEVVIVETDHEELFFKIEDKE